MNTRQAETKSRCVVCQGIIVKRYNLFTQVARANDPSEPIVGSLSYTSGSEVQGYHCSACGLAYYKLPNGEK